ncbi:MAG TPA: DUF2975 domain-containing protein [Candidatus Paceibacterota bacterium]|jgi:Protein of unknown function (DUF3036).
MKKGSTYFLRFAVFIMGLIVLALCIFALPSIWKGGSAEYPSASNSVFLIVIGLYATTIPFFIALWQTLKLLGYIDRNTAFSELSVRALRNIKRSWTVISILYIAGVPLLFPIADADDAPGLILIGAAIACAPITVAVFAAVLERLLKNAIDIKSENDLTV